MHQCVLGRSVCQEILYCRLFVQCLQHEPEEKYFQSTLYWLEINLNPMPPTSVQKEMIFTLEVLITTVL